MKPSLQSRQYHDLITKARLLSYYENRLVMCLTGNYCYRIEAIAPPGSWGCWRVSFCYLFGPYSTGLTREGAQARVNKNKKIMARPEITTTVDRTT